VIFRQLFEPQSCTYTYLIGCRDTGHAVLIDPVLETFVRDLEIIRELGLTLAYTLDSHIHADHLTSALKLKSETGSKIALPAAANVACGDVAVHEGEPFTVGHLRLDALFTPGHTDHHHCYTIESGAWGALFSGDCLLIDGCGRTDFQGGSATQQFASVRDKLFSLPAETLVFPGHDYHGRAVSTIGQERTRNPRLKDAINVDQFVEIMAGLNLPYPKKMDMAVPANVLCGKCPDDIPATMKRLCEITPQG